MAAPQPLLSPVPANGGQQASHTWASFFPWEPPPPFAPPAVDPQTLERIGVTVRWATKAGPGFVSMMQEKHAADPGFAFLFPTSGVAHAYWRWSLFAGLHGLPVETPPAAGNMHPGQPPVSNAQPQPQPQSLAPAAGGWAALPAEVESGFRQVLEVLTGSKDSIKSSQQWFMSCTPHAAGMAHLMARRLVGLPEYDKQLHIIYLANDILCKTKVRLMASGALVE
eukprot:365530-Chlamydomonas_euryale.AAC.31